MGENEFLRYLNERLEPDFDRGLLFWREADVRYFKTKSAHKTWNTRFKGKEAGTSNGGYTSISLSGKSYLKHRLLYMMYYNLVLGDDEILDHINTNTLDDRIINLRIATRSQNGMNRGLQQNNTSGCSGISWCKEREKWEVHIKINGVKKNLGRYDSLDDAVMTRKQAEITYFRDYRYKGV